MENRGVRVVTFVTKNLFRARQNKPQLRIHYFRIIYDVSYVEVYFSFFF